MSMPYGIPERLLRLHGAVRSFDVARRSRVQSAVLLITTVSVVWLVLSAPAVAAAQGASAMAQEVPSSNTPVASATEASVRRSSQSRLSQKTVSISVKDSTVEFVLNEIAKQSKLKVIYANGTAARANRITMRLERVTSADAIRRALQDTGLSASFASDGETVVIREGRKPVPGTKEDSVTGTVQGVVTDSATGRALAGVAVVVQGTRISAMTDDNGSYVLQKVPAGTQVVSVRMLGYRTAAHTVTMGSRRRAILNVALVSTAAMLNEVVTTVTGAQRKLEIGNAITSIKVDSVLQVAPVSSLTELLENRVPGLTVVRGSGQPGDPSRLRLRGASSINSSNDMIVVVDGVRVDAQPKGFSAKSSGLDVESGGYLGSSPFDLIDPNSIETIDVFKGPSAAAMYGSDAANGVLVITTKQGRAGPTKVTATTTRGISYMPGSYPEGTYAYGWSKNATYGNARYGRCVPSDPASLCVVDRIEKYQALNDPYYTVLGRGTAESYSMTASGGAPTAQYSFTGSATSEVGLMKMSQYLTERYQTLRSEDMPRWMRRPDQYKTLNGTGQIASQIKPDLLLRVTTGASASTQRKTALGSTSIAAFSRLSKDETISDDQDRFYERMYRRTSATTQTAQLNWTPGDRIRATATAGVNTTNVVDETMLPAGFVGADASGKYGSYGNGRLHSQSRTMNLTAEMPVLRERVRIIMGTTYNGNDDETFRIASKTVPEGVTRPSYFEEGASVTTAKVSTLGWYVEPRMNLQSRFFVMPGFRLDNNGLSGKNAGAFLLPKLNLSWVMSDGDFLPWKDRISLLRLRAAGGVAGTQPGVSDRVRLIQESATTALATDALVFTSLGNTRLQPERSTEFEGGIDLDVWNGRAGIVYTLYNKVRYDAIERVNLAPSVILGATVFAQNIGTIRNAGHEFEFRVTPIERLTVAWTTNGSVAVNSNRVVKLRAGLLPLTRDGTNWRGGKAMVVEGYPLWGVWANPIAGYEDIDGNGILTIDEVTLADTLVYLGQPDPKGTLSWSNNIRLLSGRLSFNAMMSYSWGMMQVATYMRNNNSPFNTIRNKLDPSFEEQALAIAVSSTIYPIAQTVNTIRLQSISLNFVIPPHIAQAALKGRSASVALQGSNLWMHSNYLGKDPNVGSVNMMQGVTEDRGLIPQPRRWQLRFQWGN